ncbi:10059_t:CDS:2 [Entrophospora sp. SA101]|nr:10059_t:CDS:2 [Entrophospora sp. SA101]
MAIVKVDPTELEGIQHDGYVNNEGNITLAARQEMAIVKVDPTELEGIQHDGYVNNEGNITLAARRSTIYLPNELLFKILSYYFD